MATNFSTATQNGLSTVYHYTKFIEHRLSDILKKNRVFCSNPADFNDPWDCKPYFDTEFSDDGEVQAATAEFFIAGQNGGPQGNTADEILRSDAGVLKTLIAEFSNQFPSVVSKKWGVFCVARSPVSTLMWSHYACNHTGICLEFATENHVFSHAIKVDYQRDYPRLAIAGQRPTFPILLTKSDVWKYEEEYRLICPRVANVPNHPLLLQESYLTFPTGALKSVIVGCQANYEAVCNVVNEHAPRLPVRRALRAPNRYQLAIQV